MPIPDQVRMRLRRLETPTVLGLAALVAAAAVYWGATREVRQEREALTARLAAPAVAIARPPRDARGEVGAFARTLGRADDRIGVVARLVGRSEKIGLTVQEVAYRWVVGDGEEVARYEITLPVVGRYAQIRSLALETLAAEPAVALRELRLKREAGSDGRLAATLRLVYFVDRGS